MNNRVGQFLAAENISQSQFADSLGVSRASISHIIAGRNKPGADFFENIAKRYPNLSLEWLITGTGKMYKEQKAGTQVIEQELFGSPVHISDPAQESPDTDYDPYPAETVYAPAIRAEKQRDASPATNTSASDKQAQRANNKRTITKIVVFYDDNTFQELK